LTILLSSINFSALPWRELSTSTWLARYTARDARSDARDLEKLFDEPMPEKGIALEEILGAFSRRYRAKRDGRCRARDTLASSIRRRCRSAFGPMP
jgi:hypothetical protein